VTVPADKAIGHRAALVSALGTGAVRIGPWPSGQDCAATLRVLEGLGVPITRAADGIEIHGRGLNGLRASVGALSCGESGTTMRLAAGLLAGQPFTSRLIAEPSLSRRPMSRILDPLSRMGARCAGRSASLAEATGETYPPLMIEGRSPLKGLTHRLPVASAQVKSALLLAGLYADGPTTVIEPVQTRDHTERMLRAVGVVVRQADRAITLEPPTQPLTVPPRLTIPGDFSSAAFFIVAASVLPASRLVVEGVSLNPTRCHFLEVLRRMGASLRWTVDEESWEPRGMVTVEAASLRGIELGPDEAAAMIDELPVLMVAACAAEGATTITGVQELRVKETDRLRSMTAGLARLGARVEVRGADQVRVHPGPLRGAEVDSAGDHRTAMSLAVAGLMAEGITRIRGAECVAKSFEEFFGVLASVSRARPRD
jgi:3-phosphoshikimate 1-carboxyvinyltransferase